MSDESGRILGGQGEELIRRNDAGRDHGPVAAVLELGEPGNDFIGAWIPAEVQRVIAADQDDIALPAGDEASGDRKVARAVCQGIEPVV